MTDVRANQTYYISINQQYIIPQSEVRHKQDAPIQVISDQLHQTSQGNDLYE